MLIRLFRGLFGAKPQLTEAVGEDEDAAERRYRLKLESDPDNAEALAQLGFLQYQRLDGEAARETLARRIRAHGDTATRVRRALMGVSALNGSAQDIERVRLRLDVELEELLAQPLAPVKRPEREIAMTLFYLAYHGENDRDLMAKFARLVRKVYPAAQTAPARSRGAAKLRIGFVSTYFHLHSISRTTIGLVRGLDRRRFEVHVFAIAPNDDPMAARVAAAADFYHRLPAAMDAVRQAIAQARLEVLFFADLGMHPLTYFLAFWRLAPVQMATWGHPVTTGIDTVDYFLSSAGLEADGAQSHYSETLVRLPAFFQPAYERPALRGAPRPRAHFGLPAQAHLYLCAQNPFKLHPDFDAALRAILERDALGRIVLLAPEQESWTHRLESVVTLPAPYVRGRFTLAMYREMEIADCIAASPEDYAAIALRLGCEPDFRAAVSARIRDASERLFERPDAARELGRALPELAQFRAS
ncbi:MAG: hypothetical protein HYU75_05250 [Betaproteobacteria bacterium]|nr:hypothetical protein [Betaproteobacteria bacterium]